MSRNPRPLRSPAFYRRREQREERGLHVVTDAEAVIAIAAMNAADRFVLALLVAGVAFPALFVWLR